MYICPEIILGEWLLEKSFFTARWVAVMAEVEWPELNHKGCVHRESSAFVLAIHKGGTVLFQCWLWMVPPPLPNPPSRRCWHACPASRALSLPAGRQNHRWATCSAAASPISSFSSSPISSFSSSISSSFLSQKTCVDLPSICMAWLLRYHQFSSPSRNAESVFEK